MVFVPQRYRKDDLQREFYVAVDHMGHAFVGTLSRDAEAAWTKLVNQKKKGAIVSSSFEKQMKEEGFSVCRFKLTDIEKVLPTSAVTTVRNLQPKRYGSGWDGWAFRPCSLNRAVPGRMDTTNPSTESSVTNCSMGKSLIRYLKLRY